MSRIIRVIIQNCSHQNKNREEVKNREIRYLPDFSIVILNEYPNYPTHRLYFREVETPYNKPVCHSSGLGVASPSCYYMNEVNGLS